MMKKISLSSNQLKKIAMISMLCDHTRMALDSIFIKAPFKFLDQSLYEWFNITGRLAFPIYVFTIAEGCHKTRNIKKYFLNLLLFALISQPFYELAYRQDDLNILFSFSTSVLSIYFFDLLQAQVPKPKKPFLKITRSLLILLPIFIGAIFTLIFKMSYWPICVPLIFLLYKFPQFTNAILFFFCTMFYMGYATWDGMHFQWMEPFFIYSWIASLISIPLVNCYSGLKGKGWKYGFYLFYPSHLLLLSLIRYLCLG